MQSEQWKSIQIMTGGSYKTGVGMAEYKDRVYFGYQEDDRTEGLYIGSFAWCEDKPCNYRSVQMPGWNATAGIGMAVLKDQIFMAYQDSSGEIAVAYSPDGLTWGSRKIPGWSTSTGIGMTVFEGKLYMAYQGTGSGGVYVASSSDGSAWVTEAHLSDWTAKEGIGLCTFNGKLYMACEGDVGKKVYINSSANGKDWSSSEISGWTAWLGIGLTAFGGDLWMAFEGRGAGDRLYVAHSSVPSGDPSAWTSYQVPGWDAAGGIGLATFGNDLFMLYEGSGAGGLWLGVHPG